MGLIVSLCVHAHLFVALGFPDLATVSNNHSVGRLGHDESLRDRRE